MNAVAEQFLGAARDLSDGFEWRREVLVLFGSKPPRAVGSRASAPPLIGGDVGSAGMKCRAEIDDG